MYQNFLAKKKKTLSEAMRSFFFFFILFFIIRIFFFNKTCIVGTNHFYKVIPVSSPIRYVLVPK